jgi:hypothetical protein
LALRAGPVGLRLEAGDGNGAGWARLARVELGPTAVTFPWTVSAARSPVTVSLAGPVGVRFGRRSTATSELARTRGIRLSN